MSTNADVTASDRATSLGAILYRFEAAWSSGTPPDIGDYLGNDKKQRNRLLKELVLIDMEYRLGAGQPVRVETYLERFPALEEDNRATLELIAAEFRSRVDDPTSVQEFVERFPTFREELPGYLGATELRRRRLRMNCPHCRNPIVVVVAADENRAICSVCGSSFELDSQIETSWFPTKLPKLGKFQLLEVVGRGAFGTVYRAHDTELHRTVAAKIPRSGQFSSREDEDRFVREARSVAQLNHPGVVPVYEVGRTNDLPYIITEYVAGVSLSELLRSRQLEFEESAEIIVSVAEALQHAHGRGIIHRDLKPANIMLERLGGTARDDPSTLRGSQSDALTSQIRRSQIQRSCGRARLMDFGLARRDDGEVTVTLEGQLLGTPAYMSPEQARGAVQQIDARSDIYSLGVILYEMLTGGELPFRGSSRMVLHQVIHDDPSSPRKFVSHIPTDLETICLKCMEKDRANRYHTASDLADELDRFLNGKPILARPTSSLDRAWRSCRRNPVVAVLSALLLVSLVGGAIGVTTQWRRAERNAAGALAAAKRAQLVALPIREGSRHVEQISDANVNRQLGLYRAGPPAALDNKDNPSRPASSQRLSDFLAGIFPGGAAASFFPDSGPMGDDLSDETAPRNARKKLVYGFVVLDSDLTEIELEAAERTIDQILKRCREQEHPPTQQLAHALIGKAIVERIRGRHAAALDAITEASSLLELDRKVRQSPGSIP